MNLFKEGASVKYFAHLPHTVNAHVIDKVQSVKSVQRTR